MTSVPSVPPTPSTPPTSVPETALASFSRLSAPSFTGLALSLSGRPRLSPAPRALADLSRAPGRPAFRTRGMAGGPDRVLEGGAA